MLHIINCSIAGFFLLMHCSCSFCSTDEKRSWMKEENITYSDKSAAYYLDIDQVRRHHDLYGYLVINRSAIVENPGEIPPHYFRLSDKILVFSYAKPGDLRKFHIYLITLDGKKTEKYGPFTLEREYVFNPQKDKVSLENNVLTVMRDRHEIVFDLEKQETVSVDFPAGTGDAVPSGQTGEDVQSGGAAP